MKLKTIPAGITWQRTGHLSYVCTIRREPEIIVDWEVSDMEAAYWRAYNAALSQVSMATMGYPLIHQSDRGDDIL